MLFIIAINAFEIALFFLLFISSRDSSASVILECTRKQTKIIFIPHKFSFQSSDFQFKRIETLKLPMLALP